MHLFRPYLLCRVEPHDSPYLPPQREPHHHRHDNKQTYAPLPAINKPNPGFFHSPYQNKPSQRINDNEDPNKQRHIRFCKQFCNIRRTSSIDFADSHFLTACHRIHRNGRIDTKYNQQQTDCRQQAYHLTKKFQFSIIRQLFR